MYEKIFGYDVFDATEDGCKEYEVKNIMGSYAKADQDTVKDSTIKGILCVCSGDGCNAGGVSLDATTTTPASWIFIHDWTWFSSGFLYISFVPIPFNYKAF